jgi:hypothetical protein
LLLGFLVSRPLLAEEISGTWEIAVRVGEEVEIYHLELVREWFSLSGAGTMQMGAGAPVRVQVVTGTVHQRDFRFLLVEVGGVPSGRRELFGAWHMDEMSGLAIGPFGDRRFSGTRLQTED